MFRRKFELKKEKKEVRPSSVCSLGVGVSEHTPLQSCPKWLKATGSLQGRAGEGRGNCPPPNNFEICPLKKED